MRDLCDKVSRKDFEIFIRTTEAPESLLEHIESCSKCAKEAKECFDRTAETLGKLARDTRRKRGGG